MRIPRSFSCDTADKLLRVLDTIGLMIDDFTPIEIVVRRLNTKKTLTANGYYWGVLVPMIRRHTYESTGRALSKEEVSDDLVDALSNMRMDQSIKGDSVSRPVSVSRMDKEEFREFITKVEAFIVDDLGLRLPVSSRIINDYLNER